MDLPHLAVAARGAPRGRAVILHSNGMCAAFYAPLMERLADRGIATVALDLPGFAAPALPELGWAPMRDAVLADVREALGEGGALVGHSLGGLVSLVLAPELPLTGLVLMEPAVARYRWAARLGMAIYVRAVFHGRPGFTNRGPGFWRLHDPDTYDGRWIELVERTHAGADLHAVAALHGDLPGAYPLPYDRVRVPTWAVRGVSSGWLMKLAQRDLVRSLPDCRAVTIPDAGHWMVHEHEAGDSQLAEVIEAAATAG